MSGSECGRTDRNRRRSLPLTMREACKKTGLDRNGERCPSCALRVLCESELRWLVRFPRPDGDCCQPAHR